MTEFVKQRNGVKLIRSGIRGDGSRASASYTYDVATKEGKVLYAGLNRRVAEVALIVAAFDFQPSREKRM